jgi:hypothetical protein
MEMSFILRLRVTGLCAIVPFGSEVMVVLPNARDYDGGENTLPAGAVLDRHIAMLCVPTTGWASARRESFFLPLNSRLSSTMNLLAFPLDNEDLTVKPVLTVPVSLRPPVSDPCPTLTPSNDLGWITNMADVKAGTVLPAVTAGNFPTKLALARLHVVNGTWATELMAASPISVDPTKMIVHWYYADMNGTKMTATPNRAIADAVRVDIPIDHPDTVTFHSTTPNSDITVTGGGKDVDAYLANVPLVTLLGAPDGIRKTEMHFEHFYRLATDKPTRYVPWPDIAGPNCGPLGSGTELAPHCPPTRFVG